MFSYTVSVRKLSNTTSKLKAFVTVTIDDLLDIEGFKVIDGSNGLFVSVPSHKGTVKEDGVSVEKYFDDIRFRGDEGQAFAEELKRSIIAAYNDDNTSTASSPSRSAAAAANTSVSWKVNNTNQSSNSNPPRDRKPLWGY